MSSSDKPKSILYWFRLALRTHDNPSLNHAIRRAADLKVPLYPVYLLDENHFRPDAIAAVRMQLILDALHELNDKLNKYGSRLLVLRGTADEVVKKADEWGIGEVVWEEESAEESRKRDTYVKKLLAEQGKKVKEMDGHMLLQMDRYEKALRGDNAPLTMIAFLTLAEKVGAPDKPVNMVDWNGVAEMREGIKRNTDFDVPKTLQDVGFDEPETFGVPDPQRFKGGEDEGLWMMEDFLKLENGKVVARFEKPKTNPAAFDPRETTALSPYLAHGMLSCRVFFWKLKEIERKYKSHSHPPVSLIGQLMWREMTHFLGRKVKNFSQMKDNPVCRQIDWDEDDDAKERFNAWLEARTGFPWIDALVLQLKSEGWVHHLGRHCIACFLTRGDLYVHWEEGYRAFERYLIDYDPCINAFSWMWMSCSAFFSQFFRVYGPHSFPKPRDKNGDLVRRYLPVLKDMPAAYIYEPWKAPMSVQKKAQCIIGKDYPKPIVDHKTISKENIGRIKAAFARNKHIDHDKRADHGKPKSKSGSRKRTYELESARSFKKRKTTAH